MRRLYPLDPQYAQQMRAGRKAGDLSQNDVAIAVGVCEATISKYERLAAPVPPHLRDQIDRVLRTAAAGGSLAVQA